MKKNTLPNGVRVMTHHMPSYRSASIGVWAGAGPVYETENEAGISHFIEHMLFKGTENRTAQQIAAEMDAVGGSLNAFTAKECTCFYAKVLGSDLGLAVDMLGDLVYHPSLGEGDIQREKGVVCEEILMLEDNPEDLVHEALCGAAYGDSPLGRPILGTEKSVRALSKQDIQSYMARRYTPENIVVSCAGSFDEDELIGMVKERFAGGRGTAAPLPKSELNGARRFEAVERDVEQVHICLGFPGYATDTDEQFALYVLNNALGGSMSSRLFQVIREEKGMAYSVYSYPASYASSGYFALYAGTGEKQAAEVLRLMLGELDKIRAHGITAEEFARSKQQLRGSYLLGRESTSAYSSAMGKGELMLGRVDSDEELLGRIERVSMEDVERIIPNVLDAGRMAGAFVGRMGKREAEVKKIFDGA